MPDTPAPPQSEPGTVPIRRAPPSVRYAQAVLSVQGGIWALGGLIGGLIIAESALADSPHRNWTLLALATCWSAFAAGMATVKIRLADRLGRGRSRLARKGVIAVELAMTAFGVLWVVSPYSGPLAVLAGFAGACLSLAAALALMRRRARQYAASDAVHPELVDRGSTSGKTAFWRAAPSRA